MIIHDIFIFWSVYVSYTYSYDTINYIKLYKPIIWLIMVFCTCCRAPNRAFSPKQYWTPPLPKHLITEKNVALWVGKCNFYLGLRSSQIFWMTTLLTHFWAIGQKSSSWPKRLLLKFYVFPGFFSWCIPMLHIQHHPILFQLNFVAWVFDRTKWCNDRWPQTDRVNHHLPSIHQKWIKTIRLTLTSHVSSSIGFERLLADSWAHHFL